MNTVGRCLERRTMWVSVEMCTNKVIGFVQSIRTAQCIQRQIPQQKIGFSKFCTLRPKWFVLAGSSGTHSVCICSTHQNAVLLIGVTDWECTYKDLMKNVVYDPDNKVCMMHHCEHVREVQLWKSSWMMSSVIWIWTLNSIIVSGKQQIMLHWLHLQQHSKNTRNSSSTASTTLLDTRT